MASLFPLVTSCSAPAAEYRAGLAKPTRWLGPHFSLSRLVAAAHSGAAPLVPPKTIHPPVPQALRMEQYTE